MPSASRRGRIDLAFLIVIHVLLQCSEAIPARSAFGPPCRERPMHDMNGRRVARTVYCYCVHLFDKLGHRYVLEVLDGGRD